MDSIATDPPPRFYSDAEIERCVPVHVVWEITLACDLKCLHCGSRAGHRRPAELNTEECLSVISSLARLGTREVSLIGGEAYLRRDWTQLVSAIRSHGMYCAIQTGGRNLTPERMQNAVTAGLNGVGVSLDGMAPMHDRIRNVRGSFGRAVDTLRRARAAGLTTSVNTQIGSETMADLPQLLDTVAEVGATQWQIQLTVAMGNAVDHDDLLLQPHQLLDLMPLLAKLYHAAAARGVLMVVGNNIGYFGPYEHLWRGFGDERVHWTGCGAGQTVLALEADGTVKGCPSLATVGFAGGNVRDLTLEDIWHNSPEIHFGRMRSVDDLWGFCRGCYYADVCRGGCTWTTHSLVGEPGNNPYCHHRALTLQKQGLRERVSKIREAAKTSFAVGEFEIITERIADGMAVASSRTTPRPAKRPPAASTPSEPNPPASAARAASPLGRTPTRLGLCRGCDAYIIDSETTCPHCGANVAAAAAAYEANRQRRLASMATITRHLNTLSVPADPSTG